MSWFGGLNGKWRPFRKGESRRVRTVKPEASQAPSETEAAPPLILLVSDASGRASFQLHSFGNVESAEAFVEFWFPGRSDAGIIAFWAFQQEPERASNIEAEPKAEPMVLIRDGRRPGVVYPFSFADMNRARSFVRQELAAGVELGSLSLYWAMPVKVEVDVQGRSRITPPCPPANVHGRNPTTLPQVAFPKQVNGICATREMAATREIEAMRPVPEATDGARIANAHDDESEQQFDLEEQLSKGLNEVSETREIEAAGESETIQPVPEATDGTRSANGHHDKSARHSGLEEQLSKVLRIRRWEAQEGPFQGFDSPPGKF